MPLRTNVTIDGLQLSPIDQILTLKMGQDYLTNGQQFRCLL
jgi:hypothetical protein